MSVELCKDCDRRELCNELPLMGRPCQVEGDPLVGTKVSQTNGRISRERMFMDIASVVARRSTCRRRSRRSARRRCSRRHGPISIPRIT